MGDWNRHRTIRRCAFIFCAILLLASLLAMAAGESYFLAGMDGRPNTMLSQNTPAIAQEKPAVVAPSTVKPWLRPTGAIDSQSTAGPSPATIPAQTEASTSAPADDASLVTEEVELPAEDTELSQSQLDALWENASLSEGETPADYINLPEGTQGTTDDVLPILLIGVDNRDMEKPGRSDTMILVKIDVETGTVKMLSFLRDMYVKIPGKGMNRLNAAYYYGGAPLLVETLEKNFGVKIGGTVAINFSVMTSIVDQLDGITLAVSEKERKQINQMVREFSPQAEPLQAAGEQHLNGVQALCYSRIRKIDSDFQRTSRQHKVIEAMLARIRESDTNTLLGLITGSWDSVKTDMTLSDISGLLPLMLNISELTFESMHVPLDNAFNDDVVNGMMVLMPNLTKNNQAIAAFLGE